MRLDGKVAVVTGSSRGIGRGVAMLYAAQGARVLVHGSRPEGVEKTVEEIRLAGGVAAGCAADIGTREASERIVETALEQFGAIDILVNNAAIGQSYLLSDLTEEAFDREIEINLKGTFLTTQIALQRSLGARRGGKIINVTSHGALRGAKTKTAYAASKMGVVGMTLVWANELAHAGINVNCISPVANTDMLASTPPDRLPALIKSFERSSVLGRVPEVEDVAPIFLFLASAQSDFLTGQILSATGQAAYLA